MWKRTVIQITISATSLVLLSGLGAAAPSDSSRPKSDRSPRVKKTAPAEASASSVAETLQIHQRAEAMARFAAGVSRDLKNEPDAAVAEFEKSAIADPSQEVLILDILRRHLVRKEPQKALDFLDRVAANKSSSPIIHAWKGLVHAQTGEVEKAIASNREAILRMPRSIIGYQNLFQLHMSNRQWDRARAVLAEASRVKKVDANFLVDLGEMHVQYGRANEKEWPPMIPGVVKLLDRALAMKPASPLSLLKLADGYSLLGESDRAEKVYKSILEKYPDLPSVREKLALIYLKADRHQEASQQLEKILERNPNNPQVYYDLGSMAFQQRQFKTAAEYFRKAIVLNPSVEQTYYDLAAAQLNNDDTADVLKTLEMVRQRFSKTFHSEYLAGLTYNRMKDHKRAIQAFTEAEVRARASDPQRLTPGFYFELGATSERLGDFAQAEVYFQKALALQPDFAEALNYLGYMWTEQGTNLEKARELITKAVKLEPENSAFLDSLGWVYFKLNEPQKALENLKKAIKHGEPDPTIFDHLGDVHAALNQMSLAREAWQKALSLDPKNEAIERKIKGAKATR